MKQKAKYRVRNWRDYNKSLVKRGSLTLWFSPDVLDSWYHVKASSEPGRPTIYSDKAIECCLTLKYLFRLPFRATQGLVQSLFALLGLSAAMTCPDYTVLCRRQKHLKIDLPQTPSDSLHLVVDATGLKLYGEGEWKVKQHGTEKRRTWLKLHLGVDEKNSEIKACILTSENVNDCEMLAPLLLQVNDPIIQVTGDGAYDTYACYDTVVAHQAKPCFPPRKNARRTYPKTEGRRLRNLTVSCANYYKGRTYWKQQNNYHRRSLAETAMFRLKQLLGNKAATRIFANQATEVAIKCRILNQFNHIGMPVSQKI